MPVFNIQKLESPDFSSLSKPAIVACDTESYQLSNSVSGVNTSNFDASVHKRGGEIVNDPLSQGAIYVFLSTGAAPSRTEVLARGIPIHPGGGYVIPERGDFALSLATASSSARMIGHYYRTEEIEL